MSNTHASGEPRIHKTCRIRLNMQSVQQYEAMSLESKPTFSQLLNELLADWLATEQLKQEFARLNA